MAEKFAASTEEISSTGQEQLAATEIIAHALKELRVLTEELNFDINNLRLLNISAC